MPEIQPIDAETRATMQARSLGDPDGFWLEQAQRLDWIAPPTKAGDWSFDETDFHVRWFEDGVLNISANCLDRHLEARGDQVAILWEPDEPGEEPRRLTYRRAPRRGLPLRQCAQGAGRAKGDRITIYMPMIPEAAIALLACARIGAVHSVVFGGFSADALAGRIEDCDSRIVVTADEGRRGGKRVPLKATSMRRSAITGDRQGARGPRDRRRRRDDARSRRLVHERRQDGPGRLPARADGGRRPAVRPLHLGLDRQAQGRASTPAAAICCGRR